MNAQTRRTPDPAKVFLQQYRMLIRRRDSLQAAVEDARERATDITVKLKDSPVQGGGAVSDPMAENVVKAITEEQAIAQVQQQIAARLTDILAAIESVPSEAQKTVLTMRYVQGLEWHKVAVRIGYTEAGVYALHGRALRNVRKWMEKNEI